MSMRTKLIGVLGAAVMIAGFVGSPAGAAQNVTLTVTGSNLTITDIGANSQTGDSLVGGCTPTAWRTCNPVNAFATVTLTGESQLSTGLITPFTVIDARGSGVGWNLTLTVGNFAGTSGNAQTAAYTIPASTVTMDPPAVAGSDGQSTAGWTIQGGLDFTGGVKIVSTAADQTSMGTFVVSPLPMRVTVPWNAYSGGYTSVCTLTLGVAP
jgi:hypothetical protein